MHPFQHRIQQRSPRSQSSEKREGRGQNEGKEGNCVKIVKAGMAKEGRRAKSGRESELLSHLSWEARRS